MSEEQKNDEQGAPQAESTLRKDWSSDHFPTSARKVFMGWGLMLGGIILLCFIAYATSEHPEEASAVQKKPSAKTLTSELDDSAEE